LIPRPAKTGNQREKRGIPIIGQSRRKKASPLGGGTLRQRYENRVGCTLHHVCRRQGCYQKRFLQEDPLIREVLALPVFGGVEGPLCRNGCDEEIRCPLDRWNYLPDEADSSMRERLPESKFGANMTPGELKAMYQALHVAALVKWKSIHHAFLANY